MPTALPTLPNRLLVNAVDRGWHAPSPTLTTALALIAAALLTALLIRRSRRHRGDGQRRGTPAVLVATVAAIGCTAYSADTSWRFAADYLDMGSTIERAAMFTAAELALLATALLARQNLNGPKQAPGLPGILAWVITTVQILPAYAESGPVGGTVRAFVGPVMSATLWHQAMGIELRLRAPESTNHSLAAVIARQLREQLLARLGITDQNADAARTIRERALDQAVTLILRAEAMKPSQRASRRGRRLTHRLRQALERAEVDRDENQDELLLRKLATRQQALSLASITLPPRWPAPTAGAPAHTRPRTSTGKRAKNPGHPLTTNAGDATAAPSAARPDPDSRPQPSAPPTTHAEPIPGKTPDPSPGKTTRAKTKRPGRKPDATREILTDYAHRIHREGGRLSRDLLEQTVRDDGFSVASDRAGEVVRTVKAELKAARAGHPH